MTRIVIVPGLVRREIYRTGRSIAANVSEISGDRWLARVEDAILKLAHDAEQWPEADEAALFGKDVRCRLVGRGPHVYRILFLIHADEVNIIRVRHAAQDYLAEDDL